MTVSATYGLSTIVGIALFFLSWKLHTFIPLPAAGALVLTLIPWEQFAASPYINVATLTPFFFAMKTSPDVVLNNLMVVGTALLVGFMASEFATLFDFGTQVQRKVHLSYGKATSADVTYANGVSKQQVLKCVHSSQCPTGTTCQVETPVSSMDKCKQKSALYQQTPALCSASRTRCNASSDCPKGETCNPSTCAMRFCDAKGNCWGECRK